MSIMPRRFRLIGSTITEERDARARTRRQGRLTGAAAVWVALAAASCSDGTINDPVYDPPIDCSQELTSSYLADFVNFGATWEQGTEGREVNLDLQVQASGGELLFAGDPVPTNATLGTVDRTEVTMSARFVPVDDASPIQAHLPMTCDGTEATLGLEMHLEMDNLDFIPTGVTD